MVRETILNLVAAISPMARDYVNAVFEDIIVLYPQIIHGNEGVFLKAASENLCVYYAYFAHDSSSELLDAISRELDRSALTSGELCFNVWGKNRRIIELVQKKGFILDMEGYVLKHAESTPDAINVGELAIDGFDSHMLDAFVELFESAYEQLNQENSWDTRGYSKGAESFGAQLKEFHKQRLLRSFWSQGSLIGCYIVDGSYITDIVVHPHFQNRGYGNFMLRHCIHFLREERGISHIYLRITKSNEGAKRLYERNGFRVISHFAEHTYRGKHSQ